ncbi:MAG: cation/multidrug efflux pump [Gammaproteobacteria bacterium]|nr:MAG: cation/multidrug efflux pump [Gammaproteobacteria bacterium]
MSTLNLVSVLIAIVGLVFTLAGCKLLLQRRMVKGVGLGFSGLFILALAVSSFLLASNLYTYQRLVFEQAVAEIAFEKLADQEYRVAIKALDSDFRQVVKIRGDEWQLDAQVLIWQGVATLIGFDANYRLHRISGRYLDINEEQQRPRSVYSLVKNPVYIEDDRFDLWQFAHEHRNWLQWVDAAYGSAVFLPMSDGARYTVAISRTGLIARPANEAARNAVSQWIGL